MKGATTKYACSLGPLDLMVYPRIFRDEANLTSKERIFDKMGAMAKKVHLLGLTKYNPLADKFHSMPSLPDWIR